GESVGSREDITSTRLEKAMDELKMKGHVVGMKMLNELVTKHEVRTGVREIHSIAIVKNQGKIVRCGGCPRLIRDIHSNYLSHVLTDLPSESTVPWSKFQKSF